jgi:predicted P-loop ATPase
VAHDKTPLSTLFNTKMAIEGLGIEIKYDVFRERVLIGRRGGTKEVVNETLIGDVSDDRILMLRNLISDEYGFDPNSALVRDAVRAISLQNMFDPVCDFLDEAQAAWDGKARLDSFATKYLACEDTPLNAAQGRKMLIAMAARARHPGIKFDCVAVLEGDEGKNKSTALLVLAGGYDFFSDESIIGRDSREVQEHIAGKWLHESADLAGLSKKEVEAVKAWASRTEDRARPAYGHAIKSQPRRCVMWATTNNPEYLQSQSGNRRFWPMKVLTHIDIEKLKADRTQLLGEAAFYESQGESLVLDQAFWGDAAVEQDKRRVRDAWEDTIAESEMLLFHTVIVAGEERIATAHLMEDVLKIPAAQQNTSHTMRLANCMKHLGWKRNGNGNITIGQRSMKGYWRPAQPGAPRLGPIRPQHSPRNPDKPPIKPLPEPRRAAKKGKA